MAIKANWLAHEEGWQDRYNQLIDFINEYADPDEIKPKLTKAERDWYDKSVAQLKKENEDIAKECKKRRIKPWKTYFGYADS